MLKTEKCLSALIHRGCYRKTDTCYTDSFKIRILWINRFTDRKWIDGTIIGLKMSKFHMFLFLNVTIWCFYLSYVTINLVFLLFLDCWWGKTTHLNTLTWRIATIFWLLINKTINRVSCRPSELLCCHFFCWLSPVFHTLSLCLDLYSFHCCHVVVVVVVVWLGTILCPEQ